jgi:hypothetical protein
MLHRTVRFLLEIFTSTFRTDHLQCSFAINRLHVQVYKSVRSGPSVVDSPVSSCGNLVVYLHTAGRICKGKMMSLKWIIYHPNIWDWYYRMCPTVGLALLFYAPRHRPLHTLSVFTLHRKAVWLTTEFRISLESQTGRSPQRLMASLISSKRIIALWVEKRITYQPTSFQNKILYLYEHL